MFVAGLYERAEPRVVVEVGDVCQPSRVYVTKKLAGITVDLVIGSLN